LTLQSDLKLTKAEILEYVRSVVPMVVQCGAARRAASLKYIVRCYAKISTNERRRFEQSRGRRPGAYSRHWVTLVNR